MNITNNISVDYINILLIEGWLQVLYRSFIIDTYFFIVIRHVTGTK